MIDYRYSGRKGHKESECGKKRADSDRARLSRWDTEWRQRSQEGSR